MNNQILGDDHSSQSKPRTGKNHTGKPRIIGLVPAAGVGSRCVSPDQGAGLNVNLSKQWWDVAGVPMVMRSVNALLADPRVACVAVVVAPDADQNEALKGIIQHLRCTPRVQVLPVGSASRAETVLAGLEHLMDHGSVGDDDWVLVHDAARPGLPLSALQRLLQALENDVHPCSRDGGQASDSMNNTEGDQQAQGSSGLPDQCSGAILALPVVDSLHRVVDAAEVGRVIEPVERDHLWRAQTPQAFRAGELRMGLGAALEPGSSSNQPASDHDKLIITDEASIMARQGLHASMIPGDEANFKVTLYEDWQRAEAMFAGVRSPRPVNKVVSDENCLSERSGMEGKAHDTTRRATQMATRIGQGYDVHRLVADRPLILGGVHIPHDRGLLGHSDADVLLHAITDALLGAAALGDIGQHFPDTDPRYAGADSAVLLVQALASVTAAGWQPVNLDATLIAQSPKLAPWILAIRQRLAALLQLPLNAVNVKAKTNERLGYLGREEAIEAQVVVLVAG